MPGTSNRSPMLLVVKYKKGKAKTTTDHHHHHHQLDNKDKIIKRKNLVKSSLPSEIKIKKKKILVVRVKSV